jgi:SPX domain protein involved in polyphosphate accumulation
MDWRYEIKYTIDANEAQAIPAMLMEHPAMFIKAYPNRTVNNIYLDTLDLSTCFDNLAGISERKKVRIRWYGDPKNVSHAVLEEKIKNNALGAKIHYPLDDSTDLDGLIQQVPDKINYGYGLKPTLQNSYDRAYFISADSKFRLTVDQHIRYQSAQDTWMNNDLAFTDERVVIEVKFAQDDIKYLNEITRYIPFRQTKHSKYVTGILACYSYA